MDIVLNITNKCNMMCSYCAVKKGHQSMSVETMRRAIDLAFTSGHIHNIGFYGGEPLLEKGLIEKTIEYSLDKCPIGHFVHFNLTTNGTMLDEETISFLESHDVALAVSYDGEYQDINRMMGCGNRVSNVREKLVLLQMYRHYSKTVLIMVAVTSESIKCLDITIKDIIDLGYGRISINFDPYSHDWDYDIVHEQLIKVAEIAARYNTSIMQFNKLPPGGESCHGETISISMDGTVFPCISFMIHNLYPIGNIHGPINTKYLRSLFDKSTAIPEMCIDCDNQSECNVHCLCKRLNYSGGVTDLSEDYCEQMKALIIAKKYYKHLLDDSNE